MAAIVTAQPYLWFIAVLAASAAVVVMSARPPATGCTTRELLLLSPCLPFISAPPNNLSDTVSSSCCEAFTSAYESHGGICLCYFLRDPQILGFPLNNTKLISLSSFCPLSRVYSEENGSLKSLCSGSQTLPPLQTSMIPGIHEPANRPAGESPPAPETSPVTPLAPDNAKKPPPPPPTSATAEGLSSRKYCIGWSLPAFLIFLLLPFNL